MLKNKILLKITGSIAAYKSAYLTSKLVQSGYEVKVVMSNSAKKFIDTATFEGLTGNKVYTNSFEEGEMMGHINLDKWADITVVVPATANTINRFASGDGGSLITALFLAHDWNKPYLIAPAMNTKMYLHPATQNSIKTLRKWGVKILDSDNGYLACGDEGVGKLLDPDIIFKEIEKLAKSKRKNISVLITSGGTKENIDGVRFIANMSTGNTGATIADVLISEGFDVTFLSAESSNQPKGKCVLHNYVTFDDLNNKLKKLLSENNFNVVIHLAAVNDYSAKKIIVKNTEFSLPLNKKIKSNYDEIKFVLKKNFKIIDKIKSYSKNREMILFGFKLVRGSNEEETIRYVSSLFSSSDADFIVLNDFENRDNSVQNNFRLFNKTGEIVFADSSINLGKEISKIILENIGDKRDAANN